jgi:leucyl aminopeptidase
MTRLRARRGDLSDEKADLVVHFQFEGDSTPATLSDSGLRKALAPVLRGDAFEGKLDHSLLWHGDGRRPAARYLVQGLGRKESFGPEVLHRAAELTGGRALGLKAERVGMALGAPAAWGMEIEDAARTAAAGFLYGCYRFDKYLSQKRQEPAPRDLLIGIPKGDPDRVRPALEEAQHVDAVLHLARDLVSEHPGYLHPRRMAEIAAREARKARIGCRVIDEAEMRKLGMGGMLGVSRGSEHPAVLIHLHYRPRSSKRKKRPVRVVFVGKGVTFDTGGISIKQADGMEAMKADMAGSATVLATLLALPALAIDAEVHGLMMMVENMPDGRAIRPGDILRIYNGKTVEIKSTDAEGRLILADGLSWACRQLKPDYLLDLATLTGACMVGLGPACTGVMGNDERFINLLLRSAAEAGEKMWQLPLYPEYREHIRSDVATVKNSGIRYGGAITAGLFLQEFVEPQVPWIHLDIAGPAFFENGYSYASRGATGHGVKTLLQLLRHLS